jgi:adenylyltransferase/sulfurtransferase
MGDSGAPLDDRERARYDRQIILPGWGEEGQRKLKGAAVFIAGAGGLGCAAGTYLAAAGVGRIRICDAGEVELSNLNRQVLYTDGDIGKGKADAAREALSRMNPHVEVEGLREKIESGTVSRLVGHSAIVIDCLDNFGTRYVLNEHAVRTGLPFVHAGVRGMSGQITFIHAPETPCLRCIFPSPPPDRTLPIVGAAPGVMGALEALEALKYLTGTVELLKGRLLVWEGDIATLEEMPVEKDPACPVCGST